MIDDDERYGYECYGPDGGPTERVYDDGTCVPVDAPLRPGWNVSRHVTCPEYDKEGTIDGVDDFIETTHVTPEMRRARMAGRPRRAAVSP